MDMNPSSAILLAMRITVNIIFIHLAGSFGWTGAPMAWSIIGSAMLRICVLNFSHVIDLFLICDDFVGFGLQSDTLTVSAFVRNLILEVCGPDSVSLDKSVHSQQAEVIGWYLDLLDPVLGASIRPKTEAIHKIDVLLFLLIRHQPPATVSPLANSPFFCRALFTCGPGIPLSCRRFWSHDSSHRPEP